MSLMRKAAVTAAFGYVSFGVAIVTGIFLVPLTVHSLGARTWGVWLTSGEVLAYAGMADLGVLGVLPWMLAEAVGRRDDAEQSDLLSHGLWLGSAIAVLYVGLAVLLWRILPSAMFLTPADREMVAGPLTVSVAAVAIGFPLSIYRAFLIARQDVVFTGILSLVQGVVAALLTAVLLLKGFGLYALVWAAVVPSYIGLAGAFARASFVAPHVVLRIAAPRLSCLKLLAVNGFGGWLGSLGWQLLAASNAIVITYLGHPEWVPVYACTSKLTALCTQLGWVLPDSGHVGLAQLHGERTAVARVRGVVLMTQRVHLLIAGATACGLLAFNPAFVTRWVGAALFGGVTLNVLFAAGVILQSFTHGLMTSASIIGNRPRVGALVLANGLLQLPLAVFLGHRHGMIGVAAASLLAAAVTALPGGIVLLRPGTSLTPRALLSELTAPWAVRAMPWLLVAAATGAMYEVTGLWGSAALASAFCLAYGWTMRPLCAALPIRAEWAERLVRLKLLPAPIAVVETT